MNKIRLSFIAFLFCCLSVISFLIYTTDNQKRSLKEDLVELNNIKYGLFNVDEWKKILTQVLAKKIEEFELNGNSRKQLKKKISDLLYKVISDLELRTFAQNKGTINGFLKNSVARFTDIFGKMKTDVPISAIRFLNS